MIKLYILTIEEAKKISAEYCVSHFPNRNNRAQLFKFEEDRLRCVGAGYLLYEKLHLEDKDISIGEKGKPYASDTAMQFSISHSGEYVVLAVSSSMVGVDIEKTGRVKPEVARKILTEAEYKWYEENPEENFSKLWTMKESVSKVLGKGLTMLFDSYEVLPLLQYGSIEIDGHVLFGESFSMTDYMISVCNEENGIVDIEHVTVS